MTDKELLGYTLFHVDTDLALFDKGHVRRLFELAGEIPQVDLDRRQFWSLDKDLGEALVKKARARMEAEEKQKSCKHEHPCFQFVGGLVCLDCGAPMTTLSIKDESCNDVA
jgi:hypothetical protein